MNLHITRANFDYTVDDGFMITTSNEFKNSSREIRPSFEIEQNEIIKFTNRAIPKFPAGEKALAMNMHSARLNSLFAVKNLSIRITRWNRQITTEFHKKYRRKAQRGEGNGAGKVDRVG